MWEKKGLDELDTHIPLVIAAPWIENASKGIITSAIAEAVDLMPTAIDLAGDRSCEKCEVSLKKFFVTLWMVLIKAYLRAMTPASMGSDRIPLHQAACKVDFDLLTAYLYGLVGVVPDNRCLKSAVCFLRMYRNKFGSGAPQSPTYWHRWLQGICVFSVSSLHVYV